MPAAPAQTRHVDARISMKLIIAAHDLGGSTVVAAVAFDEWDAGEASRTFASRIAPVDPPGRGPRGTAELAAVLQLLREHTLEPEVIVIDGPVHLDAAEKPGWGRQLFDALGGRSAVIGMSTRTMHGRRRMPTLMKMAIRLARGGAG